MADLFSSPEFEAEYTYHGSDLGATWTRKKTTFRLWAPTARWAKVVLYKSGTLWTDDRIRRVSMKPDVNGTWIAQIKGDLNGVYYTYQVSRNRQIVEACDPYGRASGVNGHRSMVIDLASTNPDGWDTDRDPNAEISFTDAVIAEVHVRDLSIDPSAHICHPGKFLGLAETGTKTDSGIPTGIDHYKNLGITHLHIMPMYDYGSVDEAHPEYGQYNWGYDPTNFNIPEGSYSTNPFDGAVRVRECKQMVKALHDNGISVVMDVVYNHVYDGGNFCFNRLVPSYFSRVNEKGIFSNGSFCGNDTASERSMVHKYIVDSVKYWADEYHIDGFRFDLVGLIDTDTIHHLIHEVHKTHPNLVFYGEGWAMPTVPTKPNVTMTTQSNAHLVPEFSFFNDTIRDALRGTLHTASPSGFVTGGKVHKQLLHDCFMGTVHWVPNPIQSINYVSCHDNNTLIDQIHRSVSHAPYDVKVQMSNLAGAFCILSQGVPFFLAGEEMLRTKPDGYGGLVENSYKSPDSVNAIRWDRLNEPLVMQTYRYYQGLIAFRKAHKCLRNASREDSTRSITPVNLNNDHAVAFHIKAETEEIIAVFNASIHSQPIVLPNGKWDVCIKGHSAGTTALQTLETTASADAISALVLVKQL